MKRFHCIIFYLSVQLLIYVSIITITIIIIIIIIIIMSFNKDKHITFRH